jgi:FHS family L-fucose permease-like MFS transporter
MQKNTKTSYGTSLFLVGCLFFIFGFITWLNGTLIPFLKAACELSNFQSYLVATAFFASYFIMALPSSAILKATGFKKGMSLGLLIMAVGTIIFIPAAMQRNYVFFLAGLFTQGLGLTILQTATNPYVTILGPEESAAKRISMMGIANKVAGILSPIILASILLSNIDSINDQLKTATDAAAKEQLLTELANRIINPYIILTVVLVILALLVRLSPLPDLNDETENPDTDVSVHPSIWNHTYLFLGAIAIFFYVGVEVIAGDSIISYGSAMGIPIEEAKFFTSFTLGCMVAGYFLGIFLTPKFMSQETMLRICTVLGILFTIGVLVTTGRTSIYFLAALGLAHAIMWPAIWPMSLKGLGKYTKTGAALLIMGIIGGAIIPPLFGWLIDKMGSQTNAYIIMIPCYLYILFFAVKGYKIGYKKK